MDQAFIPSWTGEHYIRPYDLNPNAQLSIKSICDFFQDAADHHARTHGFGFDQLPPQRAWIMVRLRVEMQSYPKWRETIRLETNSTGTDRFFAFRDYWLWDLENRALGSAVSQWIFMDTEHRRPTRIPNEIEAMPFNTERRALPPFPTLTAPQRTDLEVTFRVRFSDMDIVGHTNNAVYINMVAESVPHEVLQNMQLKTIDAQFKGESKYNDVILSQTEIVADGHFRHRLIRESDGKELVIGESTWTKCV